MLCRDVWSHIHEHLDIFSILRMSQVDTYHLKIFDKHRERINFCKFNLELACEYLELPYVKDLYFSLIERRNLWSVWEYLVGKKPKPLFDYERGLYCASRGEKRSTIVWILELADIQNNRIFATILHNVWAERSIDYAKFLFDLFKDRCNPIQDWISISLIQGSFSQACRNQNISMAKYLLEVGQSHPDGPIDIHMQDDGIFEDCCKNGNIETARWLYELSLNGYGPIDVYKWGGLMLDIACCNNHLTMVQLLMEMDQTQLRFDYNRVITVFTRVRDKGYVEITNILSTYIDNINGKN